MSPQHGLSLARPLLGAFVFQELYTSTSSVWVLPATIAACAADYFDGRIARSRDEVTRGGRYLDNLCDALFLLFVFSAFAWVNVWSHPVGGSAIRYSQYANWLPVWGLAASFGTYMLRWPLEARGRAPYSSPQGHTAGIANYALALLGAAAVLPGVFLTPWILEPTFVTVALLNLSAGADNMAIWFRARFAASK